MLLFWVPSQFAADAAAIRMLSGYFPAGLLPSRFVECPYYKAECRTNSTDLAEVSAFSAMMDFFENRPGLAQLAEVFRALFDGARLVTVGADINCLFRDGFQNASPDFPNDVPCFWHRR